MARIFFCAGESSGDIHGANLIRALLQADPSLVCEGLGGRHMSEAGMDLRYDLASKAVMGFTEVVKSFGWIRRLFLDTAAYLEDAKPACIVLIDYPGFNLRLARRAKASGIPVIYYISPQIWAWKKGRLKTIAQVVDKMLVILPFEQELYEEEGLDCTWVGHPLLDHIEARPASGQYDGEFVVGILPGSREQEIRRLLATMLDVARGIRECYPHAKFVTPCVDEMRQAQICAIASDFPLETAIGNTYEVLDAARFCMVASGTATLETALFGVPMVVLYRVSPLTYWLARRLVHIEHIALANILASKKVVPEYIQGDVTVEKVLPAALELLDDSARRKTMLEDFAQVRDNLGGGGASKRAASQILDTLAEHSDGRNRERHPRTNHG